MTEPVFLPRAALAEKASQIIDRQALTVFVAPIGYGKTTLARAVAALSPNQSCYYATPAGPHDAPFVWHDLFSRLETQGLDIARPLLRLGFPAAASQWRQALELMRGLARPIRLILDDCHHLTDPALLAFWQKTIQAGLPNLRLILFSRTRPDLSLVELRIKNQAAVLEQDFLAFSEAEVREFFQMNGADDQAAALAWQYSEGWPAALWLWLQSWLNRGGPPEGADINSLLAQTVFAAYNPDERDLLMRLSVLEHFTEADAARIAAGPHSSAQLRNLREKNAFLTYDQKAGHYQFHSLFRDFLRQELAVATHIEKPGLYRLAGECCVSRSDLMAAIRLFARAGRAEDWRRLLDMFLFPEYDQAFVFFQKEISDIAEAVPWSVRLMNPLGWLAFVVMCLELWNDHRAGALLAEAEEYFLGHPEIPEYLQKRLRGEFEIMAGLFAFNDVWALCKHYQEAHRLLDGPSVFLADGTAWGYGSPSGSFIALREAGRYLEMVEYVGRHWHLTFKLTNGTTKGGEKMLWAEYCLERGQFDQARTVAREVLNGSHRSQHVAAALAAVFCLARAALALGDRQEALRLLTIPRPEVERLGVTEHFECHDLAAGYVNAVLGRLESIPVWLSNGEMFDPPHNSLPQVFGLSVTVYAKALLLKGDYRRLMTVADEVPTASAPLDCLFARIHGRVLKALAVWHTQASGQALAILAEALDLSRPDGIILPLAEYGWHIAPLLRRLKRAEPQDKHLAAVLALAANFVPAPELNRPNLTPREREFMKYVTEGLSNPAIARRFGLAEITVKKILGSAYHKLGVGNRVDATRQFLKLYGDGPAKG